MRAWLVILLLVACKDAAPPRIDRATLWALTPDNAVAGMIVTPAALQRLEDGYTALREIARLPEFADISGAIEELERGLKRPVTLGALGLSAHEATALFLVDDLQPIIVVPLADQRRFIQVNGGTRGPTFDRIEGGFQCSLVKDVYACARNVALFERLGKGRVPDIVDAVGVRGEIEAFLAAPGGPDVAATIQLSRGTFTVHAVAKRLPAPLLMMFANTKPRIEPTTAGFVTINFGPVLATFARGVPEEPLVEGVTLAAAVKSLAGPLTVTVAHGATMLDARVPLHDDGPAQRLLSQCDKLAELEDFETVVTGGSCHLEIEDLDLKIDGWVDDKTLRFGERATASRDIRTTMSPGGQLLANGEWTLSALGRGSVFAPTAWPRMMDSLPVGYELRIISLFTELGVGLRRDGELLRGVATVRTIWENPDDVVAKLVAIEPKDIVSGKAARRGKEIAEAAPTSPFAADYRAGMASLFIPFALVGGLAEGASDEVRANVKW